MKKVVKKVGVKSPKAKLSTILPTPIPTQAVLPAHVKIDDLAEGLGVTNGDKSIILHRLLRLGALCVDRSLDDGLIDIGSVRLNLKEDLG